MYLWIFRTKSGAIKPPPFDGQVESNLPKLCDRLPGLTHMAGKWN